MDSSTAHAAPAARQHFAVLDGLRALAALIVVTDHVPTVTLKALLPHRVLAVDFFFVLSGFVVMHAYGARLTGVNAIGAARFLLLRLARFWPMLTAAFALAALAALLQGGGGRGAAQWLGSLVFGLAFLPTPQPLSLLDWSPFPLVSPAYSMFFELFANLALALSFSRLGPRLLTLIIAVSALALVAVGLRYGTIAVGWGYANIKGGFIRVLFSFFAGVAVYRVWRRGKAPALPAWAAFALLFAALAMPATRALSMPYEIVAAWIVFPLLVLISAGSRVEGRAERLCLRLGALSYGFYLLHWPLSLVINWALSRLGIDPPQLDLALFALVVLLALALTWCVERAYERPLRRWLARRLGLARAGSTA